MKTITVIDEAKDYTPAQLRRLIKRLTLDAKIDKVIADFTGSVDPVGEVDPIPRPEKP